MGNHSTLSLGVSPDIFSLILSVSMVVLMGLNAFGTILQSFWIIFFLDFPCGVRNRMQDKILFKTVTIFTFFVSTLL